MKNKEKTLILSLTFILLLLPAYIVLKNNFKSEMDIKSTEILCLEGCSELESATLNLSFIDSAVEETDMLDQELSDTVSTRKSNALRSSEDLKKIILAMKRY